MIHQPVFKKMILMLPIAIFLMLMSAFSLTLQAQQNNVGVGAIIGTPNGINVKGWVSNTVAIDGALSFTIGENTSSFYLHSDVLLHRDLSEHGVTVESGRLDFYYGAGIRLQWVDVIDDIYTGLRGPTGISYRFEETPADLFFELVPTIDINPAFQFSFSGGIGARYYFGD